MLFLSPSYSYFLADIPLIKIFRALAKPSLTGTNPFSSLASGFTSTEGLLVISPFLFVT